MLTPVTPNPITTSTTIKSHGSESRTTAGHNQAEAQVVPQAAAHNAGIGLDAGTILSNVNAEAATAGNRTILQTLALAVAAQLNIARRNDETMDAFFLRIAAAIDAMAPDDQAATEARAGLKLLKISLPELAAALKQPDSALAARLSAIAEAPMATPQKTAAAVATTTYLQEAASNSRAAETLAMVTQLRSNPDGGSLFSSNPAEAERRQPADARSLQMQLASLFEPGVAETRMEIAGKEEPASTLLAGTDGATGEAPAGSQQSAAVELDETAEASGDASDPLASAEFEPSETAPDVDEPQALLRSSDAKQAVVETKLADGAAAGTRASEVKANTTALAAAAAAPDEKADNAPVLPKPEPRVIGLPLSQSNNSPSLAMRIRAIAQELAPNKTPIDDDKVPKNDGGPRVQTLLALKGIAEIVVPAAAEQAAADMPHAAAPKSDAVDEAVETAAPAASELADDDAAPNAAIPAAQNARRDDADGKHGLPAPLPDADDAAEVTKGRHEAAAEGQAAARPTDAQAGTTPARAGNPEAVPFGYATLQPAKDEFRAKAAEERGRHEEEDDTGEDQEREDPEARRERLARKAVDDLLRPEPDKDPDVKITRDSSQADRAYALYQRMAGF